MPIARLLADPPPSPVAAARTHLPICPDCPAPRAGIFDELVSADTGCRLRCVALAARQPLSIAWPETHAFALVRRGAVIRQRIDRHGRASAVDAIGSGGGFFVQEGHPESSAAGFAASATLLCLCPAPVLRGHLEQGEPAASDLWRLAQVALERVERIADAGRRNTVRGRFAALLVALGDTLGPSPRPLVPACLQQRDLAALIAVRHESVCRVLRTMCEQRLVRRDDEGIHLLDRERLLTIAE